MKKFIINSLLVCTCLTASCKSEVDEYDEVYSFKGSENKNIVPPNLLNLEEFLVEFASSEDKNRNLLLSDSVYEMGAVFEDLFLNNNPCSIPSKIKKKLSNKVNWVPRNFPIGVIPSKARKSDGQAVSRYLNFMTVSDLDGNSRNIQVDPIFMNIPVFMVDPTTTTNAAYNIDCSGYLNAALEAEAGAAGKADIQTSANINLTQEGGLSVIYGLFNPPIVHFMGMVNSMHPEVIRKYKLDFMVALKIAMINAKNTEFIIPLKQIEAINIANNAKSNFNGKTDLSIGVNLGASLDLNAGFSVQKSIYYSEFDTYVTDSKQLSLNDSIFLSDVHEHLKLAFTEAYIIGSPKIENTYTVIFDISAPNSLSNWKIKECTSCTINTNFDKGNQVISFRVTYPKSTKPGNYLTLKSEKWKDIILEKIIPLI